ncbi:MAG: holo-ACP synthase [Lachnospiraceae bacterium]|nr:holo-ACP synthase [Lachnospiraceae bacterium]
MIAGIGTDMIEIKRIKKACEKESFLVRCFTAKELELIGQDPQKAAGNFAVKEAVSKVFGTGFSGFRPIDIEVLRDEKGKPFVNLYGGAEETAAKLGITVIHVSITDTEEYAAAFAVGERADG